jgi:hypothetical protein
MQQCICNSVIKRANLGANTNGDNELVALVANKKIRVISLFMTVLTAGTVRFESGTSDGFLTGAIHLAVGTPLVLPYNPVGWFETVSGQSLNMILPGTLAASGMLTYQEV